MTYLFMTIQYISAYKRGSNPGDFEQDQFTDKFGTQIVENQIKMYFH